MTGPSADLSCVACGGTTEVAGHGVIAPFIASLIHIPVGQPSELRRCLECDLGYFDYRYDESEMSLLYGGYRGPEYSSVRHHWEPWYSAKVNDANAAGNEAVRDRLEFMTGILRRAGVPDELDYAVDFGGDEGQFFPDIPIKHKLVCDVSDRAVAPDVERIAELSVLADKTVDLVIVAHVLEHLSDPRAPLAEIREIIGDEGILYVEVPLDRARLRAFHASDRYRSYLHWVSARRIPFILMDFLTGIWRQFERRLPPFGVIKQSEHINYFDAASVRSLLRASGFRIIAERHDPGAKAGGLRIGRYGVAARPD
jgi:SAM-dependent methyltransferase